ncbi:hypothetical protein EYF80_028139 [Liparis tanakae]|uniref:Uncharacterized protein n=1 Tax=Liparis tanakae TaxID=230148 RepID=A0A4Z2H9T1_9TELE|nr:hypothetical protein EYF80_028139 [Liparis tanakae]
MDPVQFCEVHFWIVLRPLRTPNRSHPHITENTQSHNVSTWASRRPRARQGDPLVGDQGGRSLWTRLSLYLCHDGLRGDRRLRFSHGTSFIGHWSPLIHAVPAGCSSHLRLRLRLRLLGHSRIRRRAAFHCGRAVLVGHRLRGVWRRDAQGLSVGGQVGVALGLLVATLGPPLDSGRLLEGEVGAVGVGLGAAGPSLQGRRGLDPGDVLLPVAPVSLGILAVTLQTNTKYTLTENSYIRDKSRHQLSDRATYGPPSVHHLTVQANGIACFPHLCDAFGSASYGRHLQHGGDAPHTTHAALLHRNRLHGHPQVAGPSLLVVRHIQHPPRGSELVRLRVCLRQVGVRGGDGGAGAFGRRRRRAFLLLTQGKGHCLVAVGRLVLVAHRVAAADTVGHRRIFDSVPSDDGGALISSHHLRLSLSSSLPSPTSFCPLVTLAVRGGVAVEAVGPFLLERRRLVPFSLGLPRLWWDAEERHLWLLVLFHLRDLRLRLVLRVRLVVRQDLRLLLLLGRKLGTRRLTLGRRLRGV